MRPVNKSLAENPKEATTENSWGLPAKLSLTGHTLYMFAKEGVENHFKHELCIFPGSLCNKNKHPVRKIEKNRQLFSFFLCVAYETYWLYVLSIILLLP